MAKDIGCILMCFFYNILKCTKKCGLVNYSHRCFQLFRLIRLHLVHLLREANLHFDHFKWLLAPQIPTWLLSTSTRAVVQLRPIEDTYCMWVCKFTGVFVTLSLFSDVWYLFLKIFKSLDVPASSTWSQPETQGRHPPVRHGHIIATVGSKVYIHGGMAGDKFLNDLYSLDTSKPEYPHIILFPISAYPYAIFI